MKAILISIKPKWVAKILNGEKTIEIRKSMPKCDLPIDVYIYCTKEEELFYSKDTQKWFVAKNRKNVKRLSNGVVKAKFTLNKTDIVWVVGKHTNPDNLFEKSCLTFEELREYLDGYVGYAWHISELEIFDKPKELSEFWVYRNSYGYANFNAKETYKDTLIKAPQSWCYVEELL